MSVCYANILLDEICLEGLEGITPESLWLRIEDRLKHKLPLKMKAKLWNIAINLTEVEFFTLPEPREPIQLYDRYKMTYSDLEDYQENVTEVPDIYSYCPISNEFGSCKDYDTRTNITSTIKDFTFEHINEKMYNTLVIVGSTEARWRSIAPGSCDTVKKAVSGVQYCILERIGRSRYNGEISTGKYSLAILKEDSKTMSYFRKYLMQQKLITKQSVIFKSLKPGFTLLFHLPRFYKHYPLVVHHRMKLLESYFKKNNQTIVLFKDLKNYLLQHMDEKSLKVLMHSPEFVGKVCLNKNTLYREIYPEAPESKWKVVNSGKERKIYTVKLLENAEQKFEDEEEEEYGNTRDVRSCVIGEELTQQVYRCIHESKMSGITRLEINKKLGCGNLLIRSALKILKNYIHAVSVDCNKINVLRFYSNAFRECIIEELSKETSKIKTFFDTTENNILIKNESADSVIEVFDENVEVLDKTATNLNIEELKLNLNLKGCDLSISQTMEDPKHTSLRKLRRINMIMEELHRKQVISNKGDLLKYIINKERDLETGVGTMDKRSLWRLLIRLEKDGQVKCLQLKVTSNSSQELLTFICEPSVTSSHPLIQTTIEQTKSKMLLKKKIPVGFKKGSVNRQCSIGKLNGYVPKYNRTSILHEFLFYLAYSHKSKPSLPSEEIQKLIEEDECLQHDELVPFDDALDLCTFVPPLPTYSEYPEGWILLSDALCRLPLSLFVKLINVNFHVADLQEYMKHPIKKMFLLKHLPESMRNSLIFLCQYQYRIHSCAAMLCYLGLVQFGKQICKDKDKVFIYVNRNAILLDTATSKAGYHKIEDKEYPIEDYLFNNLSDVKNYWTRLQEVSFCTPLGERYASLGEEVVTEALDKKLSYVLKEVTPETAKEIDCGYIPGDGCGAAGLDSNIYIHLKRSWSFGHLSNSKVLKKNSTEKKNILINVPRKKRSLARSHVHTTSFVPSINTNKRVRVISVRKNNKHALPKCGIDLIDQEALRILGQKRAKWSHEEDNILCLTKIAMDIMYPGNRLMLLTTIRDILHKLNKNSADKTSQACKRRLAFLTHNSNFVQRINSKIIEIKQKTTLYEEYHNLYSRLEVNKSLENLTKYKVKLVEFVTYLMYEKYDKPTSIILPKTLEEVYKYYTVKKQEEVQPNRFIDANSGDIRNGIICSIIHSTLACAFVKDFTIFSMLSIYRKFPEILLRNNLIKLRKLGMISLKKSSERKTERLELNRYTTNFFKLSINYFNNLCSEIPNKVFDQLMNCIKKLKEKNSMDLDSLNGGITASLLDLFYLEFVNLDMEIPENILIEPKSMIADEAEGSGNEDESNDGFQFSSKVGSLQIIESNPQHSHEKYIVNTCNISMSLKCKVADIINLCSENSTEEICNEIISDGVIHVSDDQNTDNEDDNDLLSIVYQFIKEKDFVGALNKDLRDRFVNDDFTLLQLEDCVKQLCNKKLVYRVGISEAHWVSYKYLDSWLVRLAPSQNFKKIKGDINETEIDDATVSDPITKSRKRKHHDSTSENNKRARNHDENDDNEQSAEQESESNENEEEINTNEDGQNSDFEMLKVDNSLYLLPKPWIRPDGVLNIRYMLELIGAILKYLIHHPTIKFNNLLRKFKYFEKQQLMQLLEIAEKIGCLKFFTIKSKKTTLWSSRSLIEIEPYTSLDDYNDVYVELLDAPLTKFSLFKLHSKHRDQLSQI